MSLTLVAHDLAVERGGRLIFKDLNFSLGSGELLELRGPNGSGKSSLLRLIAGLNFPAKGKIELQGHAAQTSAPAHMHYIAHTDAIKSHLTVKQNLQFWSGFLGAASASDGVLKALSVFNLSTMADDQARLLSSGQRRRLSLSRLAVVKRPVWLLDEPDVGLDEPSLLRLQHLIVNHLENKGLVIAATHTDLGLPAHRKLTLEPRG